MAISGFEIDLTKEFPHLPSAPIVEAVIQWHARTERAWERDELRAELERRIPRYPYIEDQRQFELAFEAALGDIESPPMVSRRGGWHGIRVSTADKLCIAQFTRDGLVFSRLKPYDDWRNFEAEARSVWNVFVEVGGPTEIQRLGVRFINRIGSAGVDNLKDYLREPPSLTTDFPLSGFLYRSTFDVPGHALGINVVKTIQPSVTVQPDESGLIIDIDVFTSKPLPCEDVVLDDYLPKMQWLKNKVFFDLLTSEAIEEFKRG